jgi:uncharacterized repeat protein (TIGR01451 family)
LANTLSANVADYNAAQVATANGVLAVPANLVTYHVTDASTLSIGSSLTVTLPPNFEFASTPSLSNTGTSTFTLSTGGVGFQSATFTVATAALTAGNSVSLNAFTVQGAAALETLTPVANALPVSVQAIGTDPTPLTVGAFASEPGIQVPFVGAIQFIDTNPPALGRLYFDTPDTLTIVISAIAISAQTVDAATGTVPVRRPNGSPNALSNTDTALVTVPGAWAGISTAFASSTSDCLNPILTGTVAASQLTFPGVPIAQEVFFCVTADGTSQLQPNLEGFPVVIVAPGTSTDFLSVDATVEYPGLIYCARPNSPCFSKTFDADQIPRFGTSSLTFTVSNPTGFFFGGSPLTGVTFTDTLPAGLRVATPNGLTGSCGGGTIIANPGSNVISLGGATLAAGASCTFSVNVMVNKIGPILNTAGPVTWSEGGRGGFATASITGTRGGGPVPTVGTGGLALLAVFLALVGLGALHTRPSWLSRKTTIEQG